MKSSLEQGKRKMDVQGEAELQGREIKQIQLSVCFEYDQYSPKTPAKFNCQCNGAEKGWGH